VITVREAARLHSYPDWFRFHVTKWHGFRQIGNSVPPLLGRAVAGQIVSALGVKPSKPSEAVALGEGEALLHFDMSKAASYYSVPASVIAQRARKTYEKEEEGAASD
jgi:DNA (cytosine-5)-methyltransferase 1